MKRQIRVSKEAIAPDLAEFEHSIEVLPDVSYQRHAIVNVAHFGTRDSSDWVLIDAGLSGSATAIRRAAKERFGTSARPIAIVLTHAHFDHVGALRDLLEEWDVPVYAHELELPYLNGSAKYPPPDTSAGGGIMPKLAPLFPRDPVDVSHWLRPLPASGEIPIMPGWRWIHSPGHTPGHVSLWRDSDRTLIAGDAVITTRQESAYAAAVQKPEIHGPPRYFTPDWDSARNSVQRLAQLSPALVVTGHGRAMHGTEMQTALRELAARFDEVARP